MELVCLGELLVDMFPSEVGKKLADVPAFIPKPGGAPANVAIAARRLGKQTAFIGKVGDDPFGYGLQMVLRREDVDISGLRFDSRTRTTLAIVALPEDHAPEFIFYRNPGADMMLQPGELEDALIREARIFHFGSLSVMHEPSRTTTMRAIAIAERAGALISFDANYRPSLWNDPDEARVRITTLLPFAHLVKVNEAELRLLTGTGDPDSGGQIILDYGAEVCLVTLGSGGSFFKTEACSGLVPAFNIPTLDASGCGDAFMAGVLVRFLDCENWRDGLSEEALRAALRYGNAVGALTATGLGVISALPDARSVDAFLREFSV